MAKCGNNLKQSESLFSIVVQDLSAPVLKITYTEISCLEE